NALPTTNLVCGIGPSAASTSTRTPSTMLRMRSTSPPKSAWPGVSTMLILISRQTTEVHLARIVMPRSRSSSLESSARSATCWLARNAPLWRSIASTSVVLPWSTWAMIAMLRMSIRKTAGSAAGDQRMRGSDQAGFGDKTRQRRFGAGADMADDFGSAQTADLAAGGERAVAGQAIKETASVKIAGPGGVDDPRDRRGGDAMLGAVRQDYATCRTPR